MRLIEQNPTGNLRMKEPYLFIHPYAAHESRTSKAAPDVLKGYIYHSVLLRNFYIVDTLIGILEAYVRLLAILVLTA